MGWVKVDDQFSRHPKVLRAGPLAAWLHVCALTYCSQYMTDGFVPTAAVNGLTDFSMIKMPPFRNRMGQTSNCPDAMDLAPSLVDAGMWMEVEGGYQIHDYLDYNPSREEVQKKRRLDLDRKRNTDGTFAESERRRNGTCPDSARNPDGNAEDSEQNRIHPVPGPVPQSISNEIHVLPNPPDPRIDEVYAHFKARVQPRSRICPRKKIAARLKRWTVAELVEGIDRFAASPWWMEHNAKRPGDWFFESDARSEQFLLLEPAPEPEQLRNGRAEPPRVMLDMTGQRAAGLDEPSASPERLAELRAKIRADFDRDHPNPDD